MKNKKRPEFYLALAALLILSGLKAHAVTLDLCVKTALARNPNIQAGLYRIKAAGEMIRLAKSAYYPGLYLNAGYSRTNNPPQAFMMSLNQQQLNMAQPGFDPNDPGDTGNFRFTAGVRYMVYDGGRRSADMEMSKMGKNAGELSLEGVKNQLIQQVIAGYYGLFQAQGFVAVEKESVHSLEESLRVAGERFSLGTAVKTDVLNLEVRLAQAREDLIRAENRVRLSVAALNTAIGEDIVKPDDIQGPEEGFSMPLPPKNLNLDAIENRSELKAADKMVEIKNQANKKAEHEYFPRVNAFGTYDFDGEDLSEVEGSYMVGVMASWDIFTGFRRPAGVARAEAELKEAEAKAQKAKNNLKLDLRQSYLKMQEAWQRQKVAAKSVESAEEALRITREQYKRGSADIATLLTAQVGFTAQKTRNIAAKYDYLIERSNFDRARGDLVNQYAK